MSYLGVENKTFLVAGVANKKSVAFAIAKILAENGARLILSVKTPARQAEVGKLFPQTPILVCDVAQEEQIRALPDALRQHTDSLDGLAHSIAFANYSEGVKPFHETLKRDFLQAADLSCFSFIALAGACKDLFTPDAAAVTISISSTRTAASNYGYMAPIKAALDSSVVFLAKSFSAFSRVRFNAVGAGLLKTSASAGIPGYVDSYLYAEQLTLRRQNLQTAEVANTAIFLLSPASSGINAQSIIVDAGMGVNTFDDAVVHKATH